ncbi:hypothetical protein B0G84_5725 [Paraburkholderia sp. BL8N3]|nr:hypothetical protein [Paraburkholderia sp. BL8N3]TCK36712.1 hypothetical protein B0G84_5725 [Paraburkholderia sp. BL8N3]
MDTMTAIRSGRVEQWTLALYDELVLAGFIRPPWFPDDRTATRMRGYFEAGLAPAEAAQAMYGTHH